MPREPRARSTPRRCASASIASGAFPADADDLAEMTGKTLYSFAEGAAERARCPDMDPARDLMPSELKDGDGDGTIAYSAPHPRNTSTQQEESPQESTLPAGFPKLLIPPSLCRRPSVSPPLLPQPSVIPDSLSSPIQLQPQLILRPHRSPTWPYSQLQSTSPLYTTLFHIYPHPPPPRKSPPLPH